MMKSVSFWSFPGELSVAERMDMAKAAGFEGIELTLEGEGEITMDTTAADMAQYKDMAADKGLQLRTFASGLAWETPALSPDPAVAEQGVAIVRKCLELGAALGVGTILCVPGSVTDDYAYDRAYEDLISTFKTLGPEARDAGVVIGLENVWNKFLLSPVEFARALDEIDEEFVGSYFDVGNCVINGYPDQWIRILGSRISAVHFKDFRVVGWAGTIDNFCDLLEGSVPWDRVMAAFAEIGYDGACTAEMMPPYAHFPERLLEATSRSMDAILSM